ncbi:MAG: diaminopimelate decarboxylase [Clostridia bacterium]|nr:diaminopimelate decarboxylase [Clostridia bacterium]
MKTVLLHDNYGINEEGHFTVCGYDTVKLAKEYGTPLYLLDADKVRKMAGIYTECAKKYFKNAKILFASKALSFKKIYKLAESAGLCADTVSPGEIYTALEAGFDPKKIYFHGNNKTYEEIEYALSNGIGYFVADNEVEIENIEAACVKLSKKADVILRVTPGIDPHTHEKIATGKVDSKFGVAIETGQAMEFVRRTLSKKNITLCGIHCHVGSQSFDPQPFLDAADIMMKFIYDVKKECGYTLEILNLGGGFGVRYLPEQTNLDIEYMLKEISARIKANCEKYGIDEPEVCFEPGRSIVAAAGVTLYTVGNVKTITGYKSYISIDGGMADNPRYALYKAPYYCLIADKADKDMDFRADVAGRCCESGDLIQENVFIQKPDIGDVLAVCVTGAYNYSMSSNYNRLCKPALVMLSKDKVEIGVKRETFEDLVRNDE